MLFCIFIYFVLSPYLAALRTLYCRVKTSPVFSKFLYMGWQWYRTVCASCSRQLVGPSVFFIVFSSMTSLAYLCLQISYTVVRAMSAAEIHLLRITLA